MFRDQEQQAAGTPSTIKTGRGTVGWGTVGWGTVGRDTVGQSPRRRCGFTLIELLVVIGIIGMLIAMLLPAVMSGQEQARQVQCAKQMKDLAAANLSHTMKKGRFPGWKESWTVDPTGTPTTYVAGWVPQIFPYLDMQERYRNFKKGNTTAEQLSILLCPSDPPESSEAANTSYAVNAGQDDAGSGAEPDSTSSAGASSNRWTALFHDRSGTSISIGLEDVLDGKRQTLMLSESTLLGTWDTVDEINQGILYDPAGTNVLNDVETSLSVAAARPNSYHQEGFNVAYCDGSTDFFFVDANATAGSNSDPSLIYKNMVTPAGAYNGIDTVGSTNDPTGG